MKNWEKIFKDVFLKIKKLHFWRLIKKEMGKDNGSLNMCVKDTHKYIITYPYT